MVTIAHLYFDNGIQLPPFVVVLGVVGAGVVGAGVVGAGVVGAGVAMVRGQKKSSMYFVILKDTIKQ